MLTVPRCHRRHLVFRIAHAHKQEPWHDFWLLQKQVADALDACLDGLLVRTRQPSQAIEDVRPRLSRHTPMLE